MKVLFYIRANHEQVRGGDLVQIFSTAEGLKRQKVAIEFSSDPQKDLAPYDLVHIFNSPRFTETLAFLDNARRQRKLIACSTIFWPKDELAVGIASSPKVRAVRDTLGVNTTRKLWRFAKYTSGKLQSNSVYQQERRLFAQSDLLLPNSENEMRAIEQTYGIKKHPYQVVRNAIDAKMFKKVPSGPRERYVLSVGRIENRKNTLKLIEACHQLKVKLILIGGGDPQDTYTATCLKAIKRYDFTHINNLSQAELIPYYYRAAVHAMVSWYETPGLSSMEAACGGCTIVSTDRGSTTEYFGEDAVYCDPFSQDAITQAIKRALAAEPSLHLRHKIMDEYTWDLAATDTLVAYRSIT